LTPIAEMTDTMWVYVSIGAGFSVIVFTLLSFFAAKYNMFSANRVMQALHLEDKA
jgi:hypothetical protein